jgi:hypothetical protein
MQLKSVQSLPRITPVREDQGDEYQAEALPFIPAVALLQRVAEGRCEDRLIERLRKECLGSEGQISHALLRRAVTAVGVSSPRLGQHIDECFRILDPDASGTINFAELHGELRRMQAMARPASSGALPRPVSRGVVRPVSRGVVRPVSRGATPATGTGRGGRSPSRESVHAQRTAV